MCLTLVVQEVCVRTEPKEIAALWLLAYNRTDVLVHVFPIRSVSQVASESN